MQPPDTRTPHPSTAERRFAHRCGLGATVLWWGYAFFATGFFVGLTGPGLAAYLVGVPVCYVLAYYAARGLVWLLLALR